MASHAVRLDATVWSQLQAGWANAPNHRRQPPSSMHGMWCNPDLDECTPTAHVHACLPSACAHWRRTRVYVGRTRMQCNECRTRNLWRHCTQKFFLLCSESAHLSMKCVTRLSNIKLQKMYAFNSTVLYRPPPNWCRVPWHVSHLPRTRTRTRPLSYPCPLPLLASPSLPLARFYHLALSLSLILSIRLSQHIEFY